MELTEYALLQKSNENELIQEMLKSKEEAGYPTHVLSQLALEFLSEYFYCEFYPFSDVTQDRQFTTEFELLDAFVDIERTEKKSSVISVSPGLIMPRSQVRASSLLAPSGAYLTWIEMLAEDLDDQS